MDEDDASDDFVASDDDSDGAGRAGLRPTRRSTRRGAAARRDADEESEGDDVLT